MSLIMTYMSHVSCNDIHVLSIGGLLALLICWYGAHFEVFITHVHTVWQVYSSALTYADTLVEPEAGATLILSHAQIDALQL